MGKEKTYKRRLAFCLALVVFIGSLYSKSKDKTKKMEDKILTRAGIGGEEEVIVREGNPANKILLIDLKGVIQDDDAYTAVMDRLDDGLNDKRIAGIIICVDSPGGGVYQAEQIHDKIKKIQKERKIPVYSVMGSVAASGGYYVSAPADKIYASNETFTGSIGVIMQSYDLSGLFQKYGIKSDNITSGPMKDAGTPGKALTDEQRAYMQDLVDSAYKRFVKVVADGRGMSEKDVIKLADGRVYDGAQAKKLGLIDVIGNLDKAIDDMEKNYQIKNPQVYKIDNSDLLTSLLSKYGAREHLKPVSDLAVIDKRAKEENPLPMYLMGGYND